MLRLFVFISLIALTACAPRAHLVFAPQKAAKLPVRAVFIATTRAREGSDYGKGRSPSPYYLRYDISVPSERQPGEISWPRTGIDPKRHFLAAARTDFSGTDTFRRDLRRALQKWPSPDREAIIYVHGFNNTFDEGLLRITQLMTDFQVAGVAVHYSWPSAGSPLGYAYDRDSLLIARDGLDALITQVRAAGAKNVVVVAHSLGSMLVMEALRQRAIANPGSVAEDIGAVMLISPDIDVGVFRTQAARIGRLPQPFGIFVSRRDRVLRLSAQLTGQSNRLGNIEDVSDVGALDVTLVDVTEFSEGKGHFTTGNSPAVIQIFRGARDIDAAFRGDPAGRTGLLPGTVLTVQNATAIILSPVAALGQ